MNGIHNWHCTLFCRFVEGMAPVFSRAAWFCTWNLIQVNFHLRLVIISLEFIFVLGFVEWFGSWMGNGYETRILCTGALIFSLQIVILIQDFVNLFYILLKKKSSSFETLKYIVWNILTELNIMVAPSKTYITLANSVTFSSFYSQNYVSFRNFHLSSTVSTVLTVLGR